MTDVDLIITGSEGYILRALAVEGEAAGRSTLGIDLAARSSLSRYERFDLSRGVPEDLPRCRQVVLGAAEVRGVVGLNTESERLYSVNTAIDQNSAELVERARPERIVYVSSSCVYDGLEGPDCPELEIEHLPEPDGGYSKAKWEGERLFTETAARLGASLVVARPFNVYGPEELPKDVRGMGHVIPDLMRELEPCPERLNLLGPGHHTRTFTYIDDVRRALVRLIDNDRASGPFNLASGQETSVNELVGALCDGLGQSLPELVDGDPLEVDSPRRLGVSRRFDASFGPMEWTGLRDGLRETLGWWRSRRGAFGGP